MLEFETEELSGQLVAHSNKTPFKSYWIEEGAWTYLQVVQGDRAGANIGKAMTFRTIGEAVKEANEMDVHETH
jgi:hypothetical protein